MPQVHLIIINPLRIYLRLWTKLTSSCVPSRPRQQRDLTRSELYFCYRLNQSCSQDTKMVSCRSYPTQYLHACMHVYWTWWVLQYIHCTMYTGAAVYTLYHVYWCCSIYTSCTMYTAVYTLYRIAGNVRWIKFSLSGLEIAYFRGLVFVVRPELARHHSSLLFRFSLVIFLF